MKRPVSLALYGAAMGLAEPIAPFLLKRRALRGKEDASRLGERLGRASRPRPDGPLVWLHGVSVGESLSLLPLIDRILAQTPKTTILVTSGTVTSAGLLAKRLPPGVIHQYAPIDGPAAVRRFVGHWRPDLALFAESELWPNLILQARAHGTTLALVSARITAHSAEGWAKRRAAARTLLGAFSLILPQDAASAERLTRLGATPGPLLNLKYVGDPPPFDAAELESLRAATKGRQIVVAASTHAGEDGIIAAAIPTGALLVLIPRHPDRAAAIQAELAAMGRTVARRSAGDDLDPKSDIYLADTLGEMGLFMRLADIVVMGGSFAPGIGGHNPLEPARLTRAIVSGGDTYNFADVYSEMAAAGAVRITSSDALGADLTALLGAPRQIQALGAAAATYAAGQRHAFEAGWALIRGLLP